MNIERCAECDKIFVPQLAGAQSILCRFCAIDSESSFLVVRRYVSENRQATIEEIAEGTKTSTHLIKGLILDGRFDLSQVSGTEKILAEQRARRTVSSMRNQKGKASNSAAPSSQSSRQSRNSYGLGGR